MGDKKDRNKPCWCGSKKKMKKCHGSPNRDRPKVNEIMKYQEDKYSSDTCYVPDELISECSPKIIKAHTVSKSNNLKSISTNNHVYTFEINKSRALQGDFLVETKKKSIAKASVFSGFCSIHDNLLFEEIDNGFELSMKHIFLNYYRTLVREVYIKEKNKVPSELLRLMDAKLSLSEQHNMQQAINVMSEGFNLGHRDLLYIKQVMDSNLIKKDYSNMKYYALVINKTPEIMSTCVWTPSINFEGTKLANLKDKDKRFNSLSFSTLKYQDDKGILIFSWHDNISCDECNSFIKSLNTLDKFSKIQALIYFLICTNENIYFNINWWNDIIDTKQKKITNLFLTTMSGEIDLSRFSDIEPIVDWEIIDIQHNIELD